MRKILLDNCSEKEWENEWNGERERDICFHFAFIFLILLAPSCAEADSRQNRQKKLCDKQEKIIFHQLSIMWRLMNRTREKDGYQLMANG